MKLRNWYSCFTLRAEIFAGRNFRVFRVFDPNSQKFMPGEISKQKNAKFFSREIIENFKNAKVFSREKKSFFSSKFKSPSLKFLVIKKIKDTRITYTVFFYSVYSSITTTFVSFFLFAKLNISLISLLPPVLVVAFFFFLFCAETGGVFTTGGKVITKLKLILSGKLKKISCIFLLYRKQEKL